MKAWVAKRGAGNFYKKNVVFEPESVKAWVAKRGVGIFFIKNYVVFEPESLKAWVAKRGGGRENFDKTMLYKLALPQKRF